MKGNAIATDSESVSDSASPLKQSLPETTGLMLESDLRATRTQALRDKAARVSDGRTMSAGESRSYQSIKAVIEKPSRRYWRFLLPRMEAVVQEKPEIKSYEAKPYKAKIHAEKPYKAPAAVNAEAAPVIDHLHITGMALTMVWFTFCVYHVASQQLGFSIQEMGPMLSAAFAPPALLWALLASFRRPVAQAPAPQHNVEDLSASAERQIAALEQSVKRQAQALERSLQQIAQQKHALEQTLRLVTEQSEKTAGTLGASTRSLSQITTDFVSRTEGAASRLGERTGELRSVSDLISEEIKAMERAGLSSAERLAKSLGDTKGGAHTAVAALRDVVQNFEVASAFTQNQVQDIIKNSNAHIASMQAVSRDHRAGLEDTARELQERFAGMKTNAESALKTVIELKESAGEVSARIEPVYLKTVEKAEKIHERFEKLQYGFESAYDSCLGRLENVGGVFDQRLKSLRAGVDQVANALRRSVEDVQGQVGTIDQASLTAQDRLEELARSFDARSSDIHLAADRIILRSEAIQGAFQDQFENFDQSARSAISSMQEAHGQLIDHTEALQSGADISLEKITHVSEKLREEGEILRKTADKTVLNMQGLVSKTRMEIKEIVHSAGETLSVLKDEGAAFVKQTQEMTSEMLSSLEASRNHGEEMKKQMDMVAETSEQSSKRLSKTVTGLMSSMDGVGVAANDAVIRIAQVQSKLKAEADDIIGISSSALEAAYGATDLFKKQADNLLRSSRKAAEAAKDIEDAAASKKRGEFLSSARFIVESLHSLAVDLSRMSEGGVSEKAWDAFNKGDVESFTRRMVELSGSLPLDKARAKFEKDAEFRSCVQKYVRQFEDVCDDALKNDHDGLLITSLGSSEVGKLYEFLCKVAGRRSKLKSLKLA